MEFLQTLSISNADWILLAIVLLCALIGLLRGLSTELAGLLGLSVATVAGWYYYLPFSRWILLHTRVGEDTARLLAFAAILLGVIIVPVLLRLMVSGLMQITFKRVERLGGLVVGAIRGLLFCLVLLFIVHLSGRADWQTFFLDGSRLGRMTAAYFPDRIPSQPPSLDQIRDARDSILGEPEPPAPEKTSSRP